MEARSQFDIVKGTDFATQFVEVKDIYSNAFEELCMEIEAIHNFPAGKCGSELWCQLLGLVFNECKFDIEIPVNM